MALHPLVIGFDADDTLWHNESIFERAHQRYRACLEAYHDSGTVDRTLLETEERNLHLYGYGIKGFTLSAIEAAIHLTRGRISAEELGDILALGREMLDHPVELLPGVSAALEQLVGEHQLILITKGDLRDQERKVGKSQLAQYFTHVAIVSEKDQDTYARLLQRHGMAARHFLMVGNSLKSDIHPVIALGGYGIHIPYRITWAVEQTKEPASAPDRLLTLADFVQLPEALRRFREAGCFPVA